MKLNNVYLNKNRNERRNIRCRRAKKQNTRMTLKDVIDALREREKFSPLMVMPNLSGDEISVDCLNTKQGLIVLPRVKDSTRIERLCFL